MTHKIVKIALINSEIDFVKEVLEQIQIVLVMGENPKSEIAARVINKIEKAEKKNGKTE